MTVGAIPYIDDPLFNLTELGVSGVLTISCVLWAICAAITNVFNSRAARVLIAVATAWGFVWLAPQAFYQYYRTIIPGLPQQVVVDWPPTGPARMIALATFQTRPSLSAHGQGVLIWSLVAVAWLGRRAPRSPADGDTP